MKLKYIIIDMINEVPIIAPDLITHEQMIPRSIITEQIVSAGFLGLMIVDDRIKVTCFGMSQGLNIRSRPEADSKLIERFMDRHTGQFL